MGLRGVVEGSPNAGDCANNLLMSKEVLTGTSSDITKRVCPAGPAYDRCFVHRVVPWDSPRQTGSQKVVGSSPTRSISLTNPPSNWTEAHFGACHSAQRQMIAMRWDLS